MIVRATLAASLGAATVLLASSCGGSHPVSFKSSCSKWAVASPDVRTDLAQDAIRERQLDIAADDLEGNVAKFCRQNPTALIGSVIVLPSVTTVYAKQPAPRPGYSSTSNFATPGVVFTALRGKGLSCIGKVYP
jgi:hypothetical protein